MTTTHEQQQAVMRGRKFLEKLIDPGRTPRVPSSVRAEARDLLRHFPHDLDLHQLVKSSPAALESTAAPQYNGAYTK